MALIKCEECGKDISDRATSCPHCGCPQTSEQVHVEKEVKTNNEFKKFDFEYIQKLINEPKRRKAHYDENIRGGIIFAVIGIVLASLGIFIISVSKGFGALFGMGILLFGAASFYISMHAFSSARTRPNLSASLENDIRDEYYKTKIQTFSSVPDGLDYDEIEAINADSKDELLNGAYDLRADALIYVQVQKDSSITTSSKFNGIGAPRRIETKVKERENWTAVAVKVNSDISHGKFKH